MKLTAYACAAVIMIAAMLLLGVGPASAQSHPNQGYGGGYVNGYVYGYTMYDELIPLDWVEVTARNGEYNFTTQTWNAGFYDMYLPVGTFNVTAYEPGFLSYSVSIAVSDGSSLNGINFYMERSNVPIPEFPSQLLPAVMAIAVGTALIAKRATKRRK